MRHSRLMCKARGKGSLNILILFKIPFLFWHFDKRSDQKNGNDDAEIFLIINTDYLNTLKYFIYIMRIKSLNFGEAVIALF